MFGGFPGVSVCFAQCGGCLYIGGILLCNRIVYLLVILKAIISLL